MVNMDLNTVVIIILIAYFLICILKKISSKITVAISMIFLAVAAGALMFGDNDLANSIAMITYYLLIAAVALVTVECFRDIRKTKKKDIFEERPNFCPLCSTKIRDDFKFCVECGAKLNRKNSVNIETKYRIL